MIHRKLRRAASASGLALIVSGALGTAALANAELLELQNNPNYMVMPSVNYSGWNYSELDLINVDNVSDLTVAWTMQLAVSDEHQAPPLVIGDTMYLITAKPNHVYALDLNEQGAIKWEFRPTWEEGELDRAIEVGCCGMQTRGIYYAEGKILFQTLSGRIYALDAETGAVIWENSKGADQIFGQTLVGNGIVIDDLYIVGMAGGEFGVRGNVAAYDINDGRLRWRMYNMGPNNEVGITGRFQPFYADDQIENPALASWYGDSWKTGGGTAWGYFTYDPDLNLFYYSTGNCGPWNPDYRREWGVVDLDEDGGLISYRNNYCASILARDATTGELIWAYNLTPQDGWDLDEPGINPIVELEIDGEMRKTVVKAARNGFFYVWDAATGELLTDPWMHTYTDFATGVSRETGRIHYDIDKIMFTHVEDRRRYTDAGALTEQDLAILEEERELYGDDVEIPVGTEVEWCPGIFARNWENDAWSPKTGLLYTPTRTDCRTMRVVEGEYVVPLTAEGYRLRAYHGEPYFRDIHGNETTHRNELQANDPITGETVWRIEWEEAVQRPILATGGDLLFQGGADKGVMRAINATNGDIVWEFRTGSNFGASPVTFIGPDGEQYLAVVASGRPGDTQVQADADPDAAARYRRQGSTLYVFGLHRSLTAAN
jgi:lanthanide-dependent methanol dehydrogenase